MRVTTIAVASLLGVAVSITQVMAGPVGVRSLSPQEQESALARLQTERTQIGQQMPTPPKGVALLRWTSRRNQLDDLISRIKNGEQVAPEELDQVLQPATR